jgi:hypothetical protein
MKIWTSKYRNHWVSPYRIAERLCFWREIDYDEPWVKRFNKVVGPVCTGWQWFLDRIHPRIVYVKLDHWDTWSFDHTLAEIILPGLRQLRDTKHGSPLVDEEDVPVHLQSAAFKKAKKRRPKNTNNPDVHALDMDNDDTLHERWDWVLGEIIWSFEQKVKDDADGEFFDHSAYDHLTGKTNHDAWFKDMSEGASRVKYDREGHVAWQARKTNGFRLFGKYFEAMWD